MNVQVIATSGGDIVGVRALLGAVHDLTAARIWGITSELAVAGLVVLADKGYHGAGDPIRTPYRGWNKPASQKDANRAHTQLRPGASCANSAAAPGAPGSWPRPSTFFRPAKMEDENAHWRVTCFLSQARGGGLWP
jgi:DDE superfamily endonuclease